MNINFLVIAKYTNSKYLKQLNIQLRPVNDKKFLKWNQPVNQKPNQNNSNKFLPTTCKMFKMKQWLFKKRLN